MTNHLSQGMLLGPYELLLPLPKTGAADVWIARLVGAGGFRIRVVLKTIPRGYFDDVPTEHLLLEQAALAAQIRHPNLVQALDLGEQDDTLYVVMEWIDGRPLQSVLVENTASIAIPLPIAVNLVAQLCKGLHAIHEFRDSVGALVGAVHGHVSPANVMLAYNGTVKLCDFGIARAMDRLSFLTRTNQRNHKLAYAAPEQLNGRPIDRRSDVFSVGTILYVLTTGQHPFHGADSRDTLNNIYSGQPALPPNCVVQEYPQPLRDIVLKALRKAPSERWDSTFELLGALELAMPECIQLSDDQRLSTFLEQRYAEPKLELHARIHAAEMQSPRGSLRPLERPSSHNSLGAVSIDPLEGGASEAAPSPRLPHSFAKQSPARKLRRASPFALGLMAIGAVSFGLWHFISPASHVPSSAGTGEPIELPAAAAAAQPANRVVWNLSLPVEREPMLGSSAQEPEVLPVPKASSSATPSPALPQREQRPASPRRAGTVPRPVNQASGSAGRGPESSVSPAQGQTKQVDAWDPATFGGRD